MEVDDQENPNSPPLIKQVIRSSSGDGKMLIKLKIPKGVCEQEESQKNDIHGDHEMKMKIEELSNANQGIRVCPECYKEFGSGKALGGHMRIHVQAATRNSLANPKLLKLKETSMFKNHHHQHQNPKLCVEEKEKENPTCYHCGKSFPSLKSLYGHMRCHPEREWRGILPPPTTTEAGGSAVINKTSCSNSSSRQSVDYFNNLSISTGNNENDDDDGDDSRAEEVVDLVKVLPKWAATSKRGRTATTAAATSSSHEEEEELLRVVAEDLMLLAQGAAQSFDESGLTQRFEATNSNSLTNNKAENEDSGGLKLPIKVDHGLIMAGKGKGKALVMDEGDINNWSDNESDSRNTNEPLLISYMKYKKKNCITNKNSVPGSAKKKRKKMKLMMDLESSGNLSPPLPPAKPVVVVNTPDKDKYKCSTCNKGFPSHQALGGHRSSHNKFKVTSVNNAIEDEHEEDGSFVMNQGEEIVEKGSEGAAAASAHQCKICHKNFPTGQALGGHKRCHWTGPITDHQAPSSQVTSPCDGEASHTTAVRKILDFDLNEAPPMEDEAVYGYGYASSYNSNMG